MADNIHELQGKLQQQQSDVLDISERISAGKDQLEDLQREIDAAREVKFGK